MWFSFPSRLFGFGFVFSFFEEVVFFALALAGFVSKSPERVASIGFPNPSPGTTLCVTASRKPLRSSCNETNPSLVKSRALNSASVTRESARIIPGKTVSTNRKIPRASKPSVPVQDVFGVRDLNRHATAEQEPSVLAYSSAASLATACNTVTSDGDVDRATQSGVHTFPSDFPLDFVVAISRTHAATFSGVTTPFPCKSSITKRYASSAEEQLGNKHS